MNEITPSKLPTLRIERAVRDLASRQSTRETEILRSIASVLEEAQANGVEIPRDGDQLCADDVRSLRHQLARGAWRASSLPGETPPKALHAEANGWGCPLDTAGEEPTREHKLPRLVLVIDALDFLSALMGPADTLVWSDGAA